MQLTQPEWDALAKKTAEPTEHDWSLYMDITGIGTDTIELLKSNNSE